MSSFSYPRKKLAPPEERNNRALQTWLEAFAVRYSADGSTVEGPSSIVFAPKGAADGAGVVEAYNEDLIILSSSTAPDALDGFRIQLYGPNHSSTPGDMVWYDKNNNTLFKWDESAGSFALSSPLAFTSDGELTPEAWTNVSSFSNSWVNYGGSFEVARYRKMPDGTVHIQGLVKSGTVGATIFTLPTGYRPDKLLIFPAHTNSGHGRMDISSTGEVRANSGGNGFFSINCTFSV